jgi:hypothetical protein
VKSKIRNVDDPDRDPLLRLTLSVPVTVKEKSPSDPDDAVPTVRVSVAPPIVGAFVDEANEAVASDGRPDTPKVTAGMDPVEPETSVSVVVYVIVVPRRTVWLPVTVRVKS